MECEKYDYFPESPYDTLIACFTLFLTGKETRGERTRLRKQMMDRLYRLIFERENQLSDVCFTHASVRAFVNRIHAIKPNEIPKSAEVFYMRDETRFKHESITFITQNRREGYIGDMFVFCYLFAELFHVDVHLFHPEEVNLSVIPFAKYHIYLRYNQGKFNLLLPHVKTVHYNRPTGIIRQPSRMRRPIYHLTTLDKALIPPCLLHYRVHYLCIYETGLHKIEAAWENVLKYEEYAYVFGKIVIGNVSPKILSCVSRKGQCGPHFYVDVIPFEIYLIVEKNLQEAERAVMIEKSNV